MYMHRELDDLRLFLSNEILVKKITLTGAFKFRWEFFVI